LIKKHGSLYWLDIRVDGKRVRRSLKTGEHGLALERAREIERELRIPKTPGVDIKAFSLQYLNWAWETKPASADQESRRMKILEFFDAHDIRTLSDITPYQLEQLRAWLKTRKVKVGDKEVDRPRGQATLNRYMQLLRGMYYKAIDWEIYKGPNPVKKVKFFREDRVIKPLSHDEAREILEACRQIGARKSASSLQKAFADLVEFALNTGMRKSEILNLQWKDVKNWEATIKGKGNRTRTVPLNAAARAIVERQQKRTPYVFPVENREQQDLFRRTVAQVVKKTGIPFHFHLCRHYFATTLLERGVDIVTISSILGHSKMMTSLLYSHTDRAKKAKAVELLNEAS
jgi:integrase